jgi:hypothetical protein
MLAVQVLGHTSRFSNLIKGIIPLVVVKIIEIESNADIKIQIPIIIAISPGGDMVIAKT